MCNKVHVHKRVIKIKNKVLSLKKSNKYRFLLTFSFLKISEFDNLNTDPLKRFITGLKKPLMFLVFDIMHS